MRLARLRAPSDARKGASSGAFRKAFCRADSLDCRPASTPIPRRLFALALTRARCQARGPRSSGPRLSEPRLGGRHGATLRGGAAVEQNDYRESGDADRERVGESVVLDALGIQEGVTGKTRYKPRNEDKFLGGVTADDSHSFAKSLSLFR